MTHCHNPTIATVPHHILDVVELKVDSGHWPAGTLGTVVEAESEHALVEISDDRGHWLDFISLPHGAVAPHQQASQQLAS